MIGSEKTMDKIVFLGGNGLAIELYDYMRHDGIEIYGYYSPEEDSLSEWTRYLGDEKDGYDNDYKYVVASGLISIRDKMIRFIDRNHLKTFSYFSRDAYISSLAVFGNGIQIVPGAIISGNAVIGNHVFVNAHGLIGHQAVVGNNVVVGPGAKITGNCHLGNNISLGSNSALIPGTQLEDNVEIGIGAIPSRYVRSGKYVKCLKNEVVDLSILNSNIL